jgi:hypothetical protein
MYTLTALKKSTNIFDQSVYLSITKLFIKTSCCGCSKLLNFINTISVIKKQIKSDANKEVISLFIVVFLSKTLSANKAHKASDKKISGLKYKILPDFQVSKVGMKMSTLGLEPRTLGLKARCSTN